MIRADVIETIRREFPGVTILRNDDPLPEAGGWASVWNWPTSAQRGCWPTLQSNGTAKLLDAACAAGSLSGIAETAEA